MDYLVVDCSAHDDTIPCTVSDDAVHNYRMMNIYPLNPCLFMNPHASFSTIRGRFFIDFSRIMGFIAVDCEVANDDVVVAICMINIRYYVGWSIISQHQDCITGSGTT